MGRNQKQRKEDEIYIKKEDFSYFEGLHKSLDEEERGKFLDNFVKQTGKRSGEDVGKIHVVGNDIFDSRGIEPQAQER